MRPKIRLFVEADLRHGTTLALRDQAHYLTGVMRLGEGAEIALFNGRDGEWRAVIDHAGKREVAVHLDGQTAPQRTPPDLWLLFAPIKKARTDFIVEKAAELGAARVQPVITAHTNAERVRIDRLRAHAIEAAEQCGETWVPEIADPMPLARVLDAWPEGRALVFCDEAPDGPRGTMADAPRGPAALLIGPEGGFSTEENTRIRTLPQAVPISLGPRVLRADTAAVAALTLWQSLRGDW